MLDFGGIAIASWRDAGATHKPTGELRTTALFKFVERGLATRSPATVTSVTPGVAMLCHQRVDDAWRALWPPNVTHARAAFTNAVEVKGGPRRSRAKRRDDPVEQQAE